MNSVDIVKKLCRENGISVAKLERELGFANGYIRGLKKGVFPSDRLEKIAKFFDVPLEYLYGNSDVRLDEDTVISDMTAFAAYLKQLGWNVSLATEDGEDYYGIDNGQVFINVSSEKYLAFENKIRNECVDGILGFLTESLSNYDVGVLAAHHNAMPEPGTDDSPEKDQKLLDEN